MCKIVYETLSVISKMLSINEIFGFNFFFIEEYSSDYLAYNTLDVNDVYKKPHNYFWPALHLLMALHRGKHTLKYVVKMNA